ncbi:MAG: hypothetical protein ACLU4J_05265 [Butyricimonas paravirosa]
MIYIQTKPIDLSWRIKEYNRGRKTVLMDNPDNTYKEKVYDFLYRMPVGKEYLIDNLCKAGTREKFVEIVKEFMIATLSRYSYGIEFSGDYKKIRKSDITGLPDLLKKK